MPLSRLLLFSVIDERTTIRFHETFGDLAFPIHGHAIGLRDLGPNQQPMNAFLTLTGIETLPLRMQRHCENGGKIAKFLKTHPKVGKVYWPGFEDHPNHDIAKEQMSGFGGMISFTTVEGTLESAVKVVEKLKVFTLAESLGGVESLAGHPASMTHASIPEAERLKTGVVDSLVRLSVGIEDDEDLIEDLKQALG